MSPTTLRNTRNISKKHTSPYTEKSNRWTKKQQQTNKHPLEKTVVNASAEGTPILVITNPSANVDKVHLNTKLEIEI